MNSKGPNSNFLEDDVEYEMVPENELTDADIILEEFDEEDQAAEETLTALTEAESRIEQANLYRAVLNHNLFSPNSARPEIIKRVRREFQEFTLYRLNVLLGITPDKGRPGAVQQATSVFSQEEITALKAIASRLTKKEQVTKVAPQINQVTASAPRLNPVEIEDMPAVQAVQPQQTGTRMVKRVKQRPAGQQKPGGRRQKSNNTSVITGQDLSQAVSTERPPAKMPSQAHMDMLNAQQADSNARGVGINAGGALGVALNKMINSSTK